MGAIGTPECFDLLRDFQNDPCLEVAQTCQLALQRIQYYADANKHPTENGLGAEADAGIDSCVQVSTSEPLSRASESVLEGQPPCSKACAPSAAGLENGGPGDSGSPYLSVDPAPAAPVSTPTPELRGLLLDEDAPIFQRYTALFALRNKGGREEVGECPWSFCSCECVLVWQSLHGRLKCASDIPVHVVQNKG